jgi:hypothetical protein
MATLFLAAGAAGWAASPTRPASPLVGTAQEIQSDQARPREILGLTAIEFAPRRIAHPANPAADFFPRRPKKSFGDVAFEVSAIAQAGLHAADYFSTRATLRYPGLYETNPLIKNIVKDPAAFAAVKIGLAAITYLSLKSVYRLSKPLGWISSALINFALSWTVTNNLRLIRQAPAR